jgi:hypothetical protein
LDVTFEYILAVVVIFLMLGTTIYTTTSLSLNQLSLVSQQQLTPVAQQLMDKFLLTGGSPSNWGYNATINGTSLLDFGLASSLPNAITYDVDPTKLTRLVNDSSTIINPLYIDPTVTGNLSGLYQSGRWNYGFKLYVVPSLNITVPPTYSVCTLPKNGKGASCTPKTNGNGKGNSGNGDQEYYDNFTVVVRTSDGLPAVGASVTGQFYGFLVDKSGGKGGTFTWAVVNASGTTNWNGTTVINFNQPPITVGGNGNLQTVFVLLVQATYYGLTSNAVYQLPAADTSFNALLVGQYLICNMTKSINGGANGATHVDYQATVVEVTDNFNVVLNPATNATSQNLFNTGGKTYQVYALSNPVSQNVIIAGIIVTWTGNTFFMMTEQPLLPVSVNYYSNAFAQNLLTAKLINSVTVERYVHVGRETYTAYLTLWKMST